MIELTSRVGIVASAFDLLHPGHIMLLADAKSRCDWLIAALHTDPTIERPVKSKPVQTTGERYIQLDACKYVDEIVTYDTEHDLHALMIYKKVDLIVLGHEYAGTEYTGKKLLAEKHFHCRNHDFSSTELRKRINIR
jgi:glycerol-3-phosphate cytidylyltransferase